MPRQKAAPSRGAAGRRLVDHAAPALDEGAPLVDDATKASAMRSADVYCAPNTGGESFGIVLVEAMAAGTPVVASNLDAFRRVLDDGAAGRLVPVEDAAALAGALIEVLSDGELQARYIKAASATVSQYDWQVVADDIMMVYETVAGSGARVTVGTGPAGRSAAAREGS
jgi:phosphatidylinositol alpha-mannosyltransferase